MFLRVTTTILLISIQHLSAAENSTTEQSIQIPVLSTSFGNATTRETETTENVSNSVTENLLILPSNSSSHHPSQKSHNSEQNQQNDFNFLRPSRVKTKFIFENIVQAASNNEVSRNESSSQDQSNNYFVDQQQSQDLLRQQRQLQLATVEKEEFIQSELHNLAKDIAETELNLEAGKTNSSPRPSSSWKSFFSNIFPQGILNVFHLSVSTESKNSKEFPEARVMNKVINLKETNRNKRVLDELSKLTIAPPLPIAPPSTEIPETPVPVVESGTTTVPEKTLAPETVTPATLAIEENKTNGSVMTNKDVFDINSAAEVSQLPSETVIPMESRHIFHIHPVNCEDNCGEEFGDYVDQLSETGDDNIVAFSNESPKTIFYPTPESLPYIGPNTVRNSEVYYSGIGTQTSEEIIRENTKDFGKKIQYHHPAKQLDDFQKEVEKQFDHNEVRIDSEAASRKFLKHFKGKYIKPSQQQSNSGQASNFKGVNHFEMISSTLMPEVNFKSQPSPLKPESEHHTYIYSAGFTSDSRDIQPPKAVKIIEEKPPNSENVFVPYPAVTPETLVEALKSVTKAASETPRPGPIISPLSAPNKNSDTKNNAKVIPNQTKTNNHLHTSIYSAGSSESEASSQSRKNHEENVIPIKEEKPEERYEAYSTNLRPESLLHTYVYSAHEKFLNNNSLSESGGPRKPEENFPPWITPKYNQGPSKPTQTTYLCTDDQLKSGDCSYSTTSAPENLIEIQKSLEQQVKHTKPYVYYSFPPSAPPLLSKNPIRVMQPEDSLQSETLVMPESYQQRQQYLQDHQKHLNQQQEYFQQHQIQQYQQKLLQQQQQQYQQKQLEQIKKQQEVLKQYQQKQQQQLQQYQQDQKQQRDQQQQQLQNQQMQHHQQLHQFQQVQQQQRDQQQLQKQQQQLQQYQQEQQNQRDQHQLLQMQKEQQQKQQQEHQQQYEKQQKLIRYNTVKVEKIVPKPYPVPVKEIVEKIVERPVPVERIVEKPVNVPYPVREVVEKIVDRPYPVEKIIDRPVHIPYPVQVDHFIDRPYAVRVPVAVAVPVPVHQYIDRPYPVEKIIEKPIHVPYPVDKILEKIVEKHIPIEVERIVEVEKPAPPKKPAAKKAAPKSQSHASASVKTIAEVDKQKNKNKINLDELLELVPPPIDESNHDAYKTLPDDVEFILLDDYNGPVPFDNQGYPWNKPEKRATSPKNHNIKRSPEFRRNLRVEYGFRPPLIPSVEIGEKGLL